MAPARVELEVAESVKEYHDDVPGIWNSNELARVRAAATWEADAECVESCRDQSPKVCPAKVGGNETCVG